MAGCVDEVDGVRPGARWAAARSRTGGVLTLALHGDLDLSTGPELRTALADATAELGEGDELVVDLAGVGVCAARGVTRLRSAARACGERGVRFVLSGCSEAVLTVLDLLDLRTQLDVREDRPDPRPATP